MLGLSASHLLILGVVILLFGARRLPELGSSLGKALHAFKQATEGKGAGPDREAPPLAHHEEREETKDSG